MENAKSFIIKKTLSLINGTGFTNIGDKDAIELIFRELPKTLEQHIIDIDCGLGATTDYMAKQNLGQVIGIDKDLESIDYAKTHYPDVTFFNGDLEDINKIISNKVDIILMLNSFSFCSDPIKNLLELKKISHNETKLAICDYVDYKGFKNSSINKKQHILPNPICAECLKALLYSGGWKLVDVEMLDLEYLKWHTALLKIIEEQEDEIIKISNRKTYKYLHNIYNEILTAIQDGILGGAIFYAQIL